MYQNFGSNYLRKKILIFCDHFTQMNDKILREPITNVLHWPFSCLCPFRFWSSFHYIRCIGNSEKLQLRLCLIYRTSQNIYWAADVHIYLPSQESWEVFKWENIKMFYKPKYKKWWLFQSVVYYAKHKFSQWIISIFKSSFHLLIFHHFQMVIKKMVMRLTSNKNRKS